MVHLTAQALHFGGGVRTASFPPSCLPSFASQAHPPQSTTASKLTLQSQKSTQLRAIVTTQFRINKDVIDPARIHQLKQA
jgi:hypothetical protein